MGEQMQTYKAKDVIINVNGYNVTGFSDNDIVKIARNNPSSELVMDAQGRPSRYMTNDKSGSIQIICQQDSDANREFRELINIDEESGDGLAMLSVSNPSNKEKFLSNDAFIEKPAEVSLGKELNTREWNFICPDLQYK